MSSVTGSGEPWANTSSGEPESRVTIGGIQVPDAPDPESPTVGLASGRWGFGAGVASSNGLQRTAASTPQGQRHDQGAGPNVSSADLKALVAMPINTGVLLWYSIVLSVPVCRKELWFMCKPNTPAALSKAAYPLREIPLI